MTGLVGSLGSALGGCLGCALCLLASAETGEPLPRQHGKFSLTIPAHDFRLIAEPTLIATILWLLVWWMHRRKVHVRL